MLRRPRGYGVDEFESTVFREGGEKNKRSVTYEQEVVEQPVWVNSCERGEDMNLVLRLKHPMFEVGNGVVVRCRDLRSEFHDSDRLQIMAPETPGWEFVRHQRDGK